jgi:hypothetical protein
MSDSSIPPGPWSWQWDEQAVGKNTQNIYNFLDKLWDHWSPEALALRDNLCSITSEADIKYFAEKNVGIVIPESVRVILVDIQEAETKRYGSKIDPEKEPFYVFVVPPKPSRKSSEDYKDSQAWAEAWFHATTDGWGM